MGFFRLIKADWGKPFLSNGDPNPKFKEEIPGDDTIDGFDLTAEFLTKKNSEGYNVYFFPNHPSKNVYADGVRFLAGRHIDVFNYVFVDMDLKDKVYASKEDFLTKVNEFPVKPTMVVDSGNGMHVYWKVKGLVRNSYVITQLALMKHFKTDESVFTVLQLMRLPGFMNTKRHKDYVPCQVVQSNDGDYEMSVFEATGIYSALAPEDIKRGQDHLDKLDGKTTIAIPESANLDELPDSFLKFINDPKNKPVHSMFVNPTEGGRDRSSADMSLANVLFKAGFNRKDALAVLSNTVKALSKGANRYSYAQMTVDKVYVQRMKYKSVGQKIRDGGVEKTQGVPVRGPHFFDGGVLGEPWCKKEVLGLIAGPGVGKTSVTLKMMKDAIENNPDNDDVYVFFSMEMPEEAVNKRWLKLVGDNSKLSDRLYVIGNETDEGEPRNLGLQEMLEVGEDIKKCTGRELGMVAIDHIGITSKHIDTRKKYTFGIQGEVGAGWGDVRTLSLNSLATQMKTLAKMLDTFLIVLTQTTKEKGKGDIPIDKDGAYGISQYENIMDRIMTIWQPLMRVQNQTPIRFLAWQYVKMRDKHINDKIQAYESKLLTFDLASGDLKVTTPVEFQEFQRLLPQANQLRENIEKKKSTAGYSLHVNLDSITQAVNILNKGNLNAAVAKVQPN